MAFALTAAIGLGLDLWSKRVAFDHLAPWGIETMEAASRQDALQVVPKRSLPPGGYGILGIRIDTSHPPTTLPGETSGVTVDDVAPYSLAAAADTSSGQHLESGDRIVSVDGQPVSDPKSLDDLITRDMAAFNQSYSHPIVNRVAERSEPPMAKGLELGVIHGDQKFTVRIRPSESAIVHPFIPDWLHFQALCNQGAVFGMGQGWRFLFLTVSTLAIVFIGYLFASSGKHRFYQFVLGLLLAGVIGNMYDRLNLGFVRDMIHGLPGRRWPGTDREIFPWIFNLADTWLCTGVGLIFLYTLRGAPGTRDRKEGEANNDDATKVEAAAE